MEKVKNKRKKLPFFVRNGWFFLLLGIFLFLYLSHYIQVPYRGNIKIYSVDSIEKKVSFKFPMMSLGEEDQEISIYVDDEVCALSNIELQNDSVIVSFLNKIPERIFREKKDIIVIYKGSFWNYMLDFWGR